MNDRGSHSHTDESGADGVPHYSSRRNTSRRRRNGYPRNGYPTGAPSGGDLRPMLLDTWALADTVMKRWYWILLGAIVFAALGAAYGWHRWKPYYIASAQLIRFDEKNSAEFFKYQEISQPTFVTILESQGLLENASRKAAPGITADDLA